MMMRTLLLGNAILLLISAFLPSNDLAHAVRFGSIFGLLPVGWMHLMPGERPFERYGLASAFSMASLLFFGLIVAYLGLPQNAWLWIVIFALIIAVQSGSGALRSELELPSVHWAWALTGLGLVVSRFWQLGYKEVQGDEAIVLKRTAHVILGGAEQLFLHQKGPAEVLLPAVMWGFGGEATEFWLRMAFAWGNVLAVMLFALFAQRWFTKQKILVGISAVALLGVMGFGIAFGRIVQYQSLVYLWSFAGLLAADHLDRGSNRFSLALPGAFAGFALLAHYDAVLFIPAIGWLLLFRDRPETLRDAWSRIWPSALAGLVVIGLFYLPYTLHPNFQETFSYLVNDRVGVDTEAAEGVANGSLRIVWQMVTFYNSTIYIFGLIGLAVLGGVVLAAGKEKRSGWLGLLFLALVPLLFYTLIVVDPRTHVYTFFPGIVLMGLFAVAWLFERRTARIGRIGLVVALLWVGYSAQYAVRLFLNTSAEIQRNTETAPIAGDPKTWEEPPLFGRFGFPYRAGWQSVADLIEPGMVLRSNEELPITDWYLPGQPTTQCDTFDLFLLAQDVQDEEAFDPALIDRLNLLGQVEVHGQSKLEIYGREGSESIQTIDGTAAQRWFSPLDILTPPPTGREPLNVRLGEDVVLLGVELDGKDVRPGETLDFTLYWQAARPIGLNYQSFAHLVDETMIAQSDRTPNCGSQPTSGWEAGQIVRDPHSIVVPEGLAAGTELELYVGMYELITVVRLDIPDNQDDLFLIETLIVGESE